MFPGLVQDLSLQRSNRILGNGAAVIRWTKRRSENGDGDFMAMKETDVRNSVRRRGNNRVI